MEPLAQYFMYFLVGGGATTLIAYYNTHGSPGIAGILSCMPIHFILNVLIAIFIAGPAIALSFSRTSFIANFAWLAAVLVFAVVLQRTANPWLAVSACMVSGVVFGAMMNEMFEFI